MTVLAALFLAAALSPRPDAAAVARIEAAYTPPAGAHALQDYVRWYWSDPARPGEVAGVYLLPDVARVFHGDLRDPVHIVAPGEAPRVMDGGCGVVNVRSRAPYARVVAGCGGR